MRLSTVFELLLIFLFIAFAAYARVIDRDGVTLHRAIRATKKKQHNLGISLPSLKQAEESVNKYCVCREDICNCCRDFHIPIVQLKGPGCASLKYLQGDNLAVQLSFGNSILTSAVVSGKNPKPVCVSLPGGYSKFCGRIYSIHKEPDRHFKACLGLELQSSTELEASLRVSCFRFGPEGLKLRPAEPFPVVTPASTEEDDDDDIFGLDDDDDDDDDDEEDDEVPADGNAASNPAGTDDDDDEDDDDDDVLGFGALLDIFTGEDETTKKPKVTTPLPIQPPFTIPLLTTRPSVVPISNDVSHFEVNENSADETTEATTEQVSDVQEESEDSESGLNDDTTENSYSEEIDQATVPNDNEENFLENSEISNEVSSLPEKSSVLNTKKGSSKPSITSGSSNAIKDDEKKPHIKPNLSHYTVPQNGNKIPGEEQEEDDEDDILDTEDLDEEDDDDDEKNEASDEDEEEDEDETDHTSGSDEESEDEKNEDVDLSDDDDDDDEEDEAILSAIVEDDKPKTKQKKVVNKITNEAGNQEEDDADYGYGLAELLARKLHSKSRSRGRQSKVMRF